MSMRPNLSMRVVGTAAAVAVILGGTTAAFAESGSSTSTHSPTSSATASAQPGASGSAKATKKQHRPKMRLIRRGVRGQVVTRGKDGTFVTHDLIRGQVKTVSASSIAVTAADGTTQTFAVSSTTKVRARTAGKATTTSIGQVKVGDNVLVTGTGSSSFTARRVVDVKK